MLSLSKFFPTSNITSFVETETGLSIVWDVCFGFSMSRSCRKKLVTTAARDFHGYILGKSIAVPIKELIERFSMLETGGQNVGMTECVSKEEV